MELRVEKKERKISDFLKLLKVEETVIERRRLKTMKVASYSYCQGLNNKLFLMLN